MHTADNDLPWAVIILQTIKQKREIEREWEITFNEYGLVISKHNGLDKLAFPDELPSAYGGKLEVCQLT